MRSYLLRFVGYHGVQGGVAEPALRLIKHVLPARHREFTGMPSSTPVWTRRSSSRRIHAPITSSGMPRGNSRRRYRYQLRASLKTGIWRPTSRRRILQAAAVGRDNAVFRITARDGTALRVEPRSAVSVQRNGKPATLNLMRTPPLPRSEHRGQPRPPGRWRPSAPWLEASPTTSTTSLSIIGYAEMLPTNRKRTIPMSISSAGSKGQVRTGRIDRHKVSASARSRRYQVRTDGMNRGYVV